MVFAMMEVMSITEIRYSSTVKNLIMTRETVTHYKEGHKADLIQTGELKLINLVKDLRCI
tara:strand:+ start:188 stop:367 length:180 start_codon:yes stop_codon:yes gene_type:complete